MEDRVAATRAGTHLEIRVGDRDGAILVRRMRWRRQPELKHDGDEAYREARANWPGRRKDC